MPLDYATITLVWEGDHPGAEIENLVREALPSDLRSLSRPSSLITHTVFLGDDYEGPSVSVWGVAGRDDALFCRYTQKTRFVTLRELEEERAREKSDALIDLYLKGRFGDEVASAFAARGYAWPDSLPVDEDYLRFVEIARQIDGPLWRHRARGGLYAEIGRAEVQANRPIDEGDVLVVYRSLETQKLWARPEGEFFDGRFESAD